MLDKLGLVSTFKLDEIDVEYCSELDPVLEVESVGRASEDDIVRVVSAVELGEIDVESCSKLDSVLDVERVERASEDDVVRVISALELRRALEEAVELISTLELVKLEAD